MEEEGSTVTETAATFGAPATTSTPPPSTTAMHDARNSVVLGGARDVVISLHTVDDGRGRRGDVSVDATTVGVVTEAAASLRVVSIHDIQLRHEFFYR